MGLSGRGGVGVGLAVVRMVVSPRGQNGEGLSGRDGGGSQWSGWGWVSVVGMGWVSLIRVGMGWVCGQDGVGPRGQNGVGLSGRDGVGLLNQGRDRGGFVVRMGWVPGQGSEWGGYQW